MWNPNITFVIFTYNEEGRIENVIKNFKAYGKVIIADDKSTDKTQEIARKHDCEIFIRPKMVTAFVEHDDIVQEIYKAVSTEWIYWGFADEMLERGTLNCINDVIRSDKYDIINIVRKNYFYGSFCYDLYKARTNKIFKKNSIDFVNNVIHGMGKPTVTKEKIYFLPEKYFVHHFISNTAASYLNVINSYTNSETEFGYKSHTSWLYLISFIIKSLFNDMFLSKGLNAGFPGISLTQFMLFYTMVKNMKIYEKENKLDRNEIERRNDIHRINILGTINHG